MNGSNKKMTERDEILQSLKTPPPNGYFVWDGVDADDKPLSKTEMRAGIGEAKRRGRPPLANPKAQVKLRIDSNVLNEFKASGKGWQTRMNDALKDWLETHPQH